MLNIETIARYTSRSGELSDAFWVGFFIGLAIIIGIVLIISIITMIGQWKVFEKAGKPGWVAIIPIYNMWCLYEIMNIKPALSLLTLGGSFLVGMGNTLNMIGQANKATGLVLMSIPINIASIALNIAGLVFTIKGSLNLAKYFGKSDGYGIGLAFLSFIFYPMLGFDKNAKYKKKN